MAQNVANTVILQAPERSGHDLTEQTLTTTKIGQITPIYVQEVVPADTIAIGGEMLIKFAPLSAPIFQSLTAYIHYFYCPYYLLWRNWQYFISQQPDPGSGQTPLHPLMQFQPNTDQVSKYFGFYDTTTEYTVSPFPWYMYQLIYNEYYRHQKIHDDLKPDLGSLTDGVFSPPVSMLEMRHRTFKDSYFSAALPTPQDGTTVNLDIFNDVQVKRDGGGPTRTWTNAVGGGGTSVDGGTADFALTDGFLYAETSTLGININDFIELQRMQEFLVRNNIAGGRYKEFLIAHFNQSPEDLRLDRPAYITGVKAPVQVQELLNADSNLGIQSGQAAAYSQNEIQNYRVNDYGLIMGLLTVIPEEQYMQATSKFYWKNQPLDYYLPIFDQMGEQPVFNKEIVLTHTNPNGTFGYMPRYSEYRVSFNKITAGFITNALNSWHLGRNLPNDIGLNPAFFNITGQTRIFEYTGEQEDHLLVQVQNNVFITRSMKKLSMPVLTNTYNNTI